jgi:uncharacterized protein (TIGR02145 family)
MKTNFTSQINKSVQSIPADVFVIAIFLCVVGSCGTSNPIHSHEKNTAQLHDTLLVDRDGNKYPIKILADGKLWMTANLKLNIPDSYCYENITQNCEQYGRLYTWESAKRGCNLLGEGWRLPINVEWQQLVKLYGGAMEDSNATRKGAYKALLNTGTSGFNALLGGGRAPDSQYSRLGGHGFYWTATESDSSTAWFYNFAKGSQALYQQNDGEKIRAFSVRCVRSMDSLK